MCFQITKDSIGAQRTLCFQYYDKNYVFTHLIVIPYNKKAVFTMINIMYSLVLLWSPVTKKKEPFLQWST
jgi:hypothetical protein